MQGRGATIKVEVPHHPCGEDARARQHGWRELANDPNVSYIHGPDRTQKMAANPAAEEFATAIEADVAASQYALDGTGVGVAVIDSGIAAHPDLNDASGVSRIVYSQSFVAGDTTTFRQVRTRNSRGGLIGGSGAPAPAQPMAMRRRTTAWLLTSTFINLRVAGSERSRARTAR